MDSQEDGGESGGGSCLPHPTIHGGLPEVENGSSKTDDKNPPPDPEPLVENKKNGTSAEQKISQDDPQDDQGDSQKQLIEESAEQLLRLDAQRYHENVLMDADILLKRIILPMSFPWCHRSTLGVRTVARDIDEVPGILSAGQSSEGTMFSGRHKLPTREYSSRGVLSLSRSADPGVIELKRRFQPPLNSLAENVDTPVVVPTSAGQQKLAEFHSALSAKRRRLAESSVTETRLVSFRFGSTSSRKSILTGCGRKRPLLLTAVLPEDIQRGKRLQIEKANDIARELGSYDYYAGLPKAPPSSRRIRAGRTRVIWSTKQNNGPRPVYRSLLSGAALEGGSHKRPIAIKVGVKLNGRLVALERLPEEVEEENRTPLTLKFSDKEIDAALSITCSKHRSKVMHPTITKREDTPSEQCSLDINVLAMKLKVATRPIARDDDAVPPATFLNARKPYQIKMGGNSSNILYMQPPFIDCLPAQDGLIQTICSLPGYILFQARISAPEPQSRPAPIEATAFLEEMAKRLMTCSVCWSSDASREDICICSGCGLRVHVSCHPGTHRGSKQAGPTWKCNSCKLQESSTNGSSLPPEKRRCSICPVVGGPVSHFLDDTNYWCHDVCQVWCNSKHGGGGEVGQCCLCSGTETKVIRCAARGCSVKFHPMCGVLVSRAAQYRRTQQRRVAVRLPDNNSTPFIEYEAKENDLLQSTQYELVEARIGVRGRGHQSAAKKVYPLFLGFCGIHSPQRLPEFRGLYPGGAFYDDTFRVPPLRL